MVSAPRVSLATITSKDLVGKGSVVATQSRRERINGVVPRIRLESHGWEVVPLDAVRVEEYVTADKGRRTREIDYQLVQQADQAAELAAYAIAHARGLARKSVVSGKSGSVRVDFGGGGSIKKKKK